MRKIGRFLDDQSGDFWGQDNPANDVTFAREPAELADQSVGEFQNEDCQRNAKPVPAGWGVEDQQGEVAKIQQVGEVKCLQRHAAQLVREQA